MTARRGAAAGKGRADPLLPGLAALGGPSAAASLLEAAIAAAPTGLVISDARQPDCPIVFMNAAFTDITGYPPDEVLGRNCRFLQGKGTDPKAVARVRRAIAAARPVTVEMLNFRRDGTRFWNELRIAPVFGEGGVLTHFIGIQHDVTARRAAEQREARARRAAERASRTKSDFLATMSHEIRTPMNGVMGTLSLLLETEMTPEQRSFAETARRCGQDLLAIINDVLDISRIEAGMLRLDDAAFALAPTLRAVLDLAAPAAAAKGITLSAEIDPGLPPALRGDAQRLRQVLTNLIDNAVKFTGIGGVTLTAASEGTGQDGRVRLRLSVADTGIGIPAEVQARLFRRWTQADASITARFGGSGLGLTICRRLVRLMGGEIGLESEPGKGSTFTVRLALPTAPADAVVAPEAERAVPADATVQPGARGRRILLAEDSRANQIVAAATLRRAGYAVEIAEDGDQAVARAASGGFDLVLMDIQMPKRTGIEATVAIRRLPGPEAQVPIVAMTASALPGDREACLEAGMDGYLAKPVEARALLSTVAATLEGREAAPAREAAGAAMLDHAMIEEMRDAVGEDRMAHLMGIFADETRSRLDQLAEAAARHDLAAMAHLCHGLRSAAGTFGATALTEAARRLERHCVEGDGAAAEEVYATIPALARASLAALTART
ncbi:ATP-binding protein [Elioraea rosea]|uniref:ATP-binding protein n=1 Tax=Elioraea rosea TaxID=2492390 RepID=UPI0011838C61|nr:ATP-binding protein [Elioraea rosea]